MRGRPILRYLMRFTLAFCLAAFVDGFIAGFMHRAPASFVALVTVAGMATILLALREQTNAR